ncbi:hypothetical protein B8B88_13470 [Pseudomonas aeruginosa]|nr:hypothetical protein B8B58_02865 [Pseudomonas aeruginosa]PBM15849.1 hypothetical protein B8B88_13470 [Pseudomonas aeruginosa]PBM46591.1 hypothetical protein B8A59_01110 [Pseudomonas aeruginosa]
MPSEWQGESFGRLQKELAWKGETRGQGKHDKQLDRQPRRPLKRSPYCRAGSDGS